MLIDGLVQFLTANDAVKAFTASRVYPDVLPRAYSFPALVIHRYGGTQDYDFDGPVGVRESQAQIDVYAGDVATKGQLTECVRRLLENFKGSLPEGTIVQCAYLERDMDMPFLANADGKGMAFRSVLGFRFVTGN